MYHYDNFIILLYILQFLKGETCKNSIKILPYATEFQESPTSFSIKERSQIK